MKIKPSKLPSGSAHIPPTRQLDDNVPLQISFKFLDVHSNSKFSLKHCNAGYLEKFLLRLRDINQLSIKVFRGPTLPEIRNHKIDFKETTEPNGFRQLPEQLRNNEAWQFQISANAHGRVHGLLIAEMFFIVWLDPCHLLYNKGKGCGH